MNNGPPPAVRALFAIDQAHGVSRWGLGFGPVPLELPLPAERRPGADQATIRNSVVPIGPRSWAPALMATEPLGHFLQSRNNAASS